ncbi:MAG: ATP-dependent helicase [Actinomycetota bacterium]
MRDLIFAGLNQEQAEAVRTVRGPVCILAGAGSGKTTTITRRIANQIATHAFDPDEILAVTFTEKAAREMGHRLSRLSSASVRARTFHAEALAQYRRLSTDQSEIVPSKGQILAPLTARLPMPHKFTAVREIATEIEWAKNAMISADRYRESVERLQHDPPIPVDLMTGIYQSYERRKEKAGMMDFEDLLSRLISHLHEDDRALSIVRARYQAFTVDEYQDVNMLQQTLLEAWVGDRSELCVVGDDYQAIFGFTGATPRYLLSFQDRYEDALVVRLTRNYRSTPQVLEIANRLAPKLQGSSKILRSVQKDGPKPTFRVHETGSDEVRFIIDQARSLHDNGVPWEQIAVLYRINGRSEELEEALSKEQIPYQVKDGSFLRRPAARAVIARLKRAPEAPLMEVLNPIVKLLGYRPGEPMTEESDEQATRHADLERIVALAREWSASEQPHSTNVDRATRAERFIADLQKRFTQEQEGRGVQILTYHRAKGLEFEAVFLPRMEEKEIPFALAKTTEELAEERRLLYVGITRAKRYLFVSHASSRFGERRRNCKPSPFLNEIRPPRSQSDVGGPIALVPGARPQPARANVNDEHTALYLALKDWRLKAARNNAVPAYVVFHDETLAKIASTRPRNVVELGRISGIGPAKIARYGTDVLELIDAHTA